MSEWQPMTEARLDALEAENKLLKARLRAVEELLIERGPYLANTVVVRGVVDEKEFFKIRCTGNEGDDALQWYVP